MEEKDKKKILIGSIILVVTLILVIVGSTYAFFALEIKNSSNPTNIEITTGEQDKITLNGGLTNYHIHLKVSDMSLDNVGKSYYGTTDTGKDYELTEELGTKELGTINIKGILEEAYTCTAIVNISLSEKMQSYLQKGDLVLVLIQGEREREIDLSEKRDPIIEFELEGTKSQKIEAYLKFTNQDKDQSYIAGNNFNVTIKIEDLKCEVGITNKPLLKYLRNNDKKDNLSYTIQGDMYRYQGTKDMVDNNYICFGTDNVEECKNNEDKYMYRIIGIDKEDKLKLIKETFIKEGNNRSFSWNDTLRLNTEELTNCENNKCPDWPGSTIFKRINGISNGAIKGVGAKNVDGANTDIFVDSEEYEYLKSGDKINGGESASSWYNIIENHNWLYGETKEAFEVFKQNGNAMYEIESGKIDTWHTVAVGDEIKSAKYKWNQENESKISLMYLHDFYYSYYDGKNEETRGNASDYKTFSESWLYFKNNSLNISTYDKEWTSVKAGSGWFGADAPIDDESWTNYSWVSADIVVWSITNISFESIVGHNNPIGGVGVRPVFYLINTIKLTGEGTTESPFIIHS